jgi:hypothetical protein
MFQLQSNSMRGAQLMTKIPLKGLLLAVLCSSGATAADLFVATDGRDDNPGTLQQPLRTLEATRDAARQLAGAKTIYVRGGVYELPRTLKLGAQDSGVLWRAYQAERPILSGGRTITGFVPYKGAILQAAVPQGVYFHQLFLDGQRQPLARYPNYDAQDPCGGGWAYADGPLTNMYREVAGEDRHTLRVKPQDARAWSRPADGEVFVFPRYNWWNNLAGIRSVDPAAHTLTLAGDCSYAIRPGDRYFVQNLLEELDAPGEWYLDTRAGTLYFWPPAPLADRPVVAPVLGTLLALGHGTADVTFRGFTFEYCDSDRPLGPGRAVRLFGAGMHAAITLQDTTNCLIAAGTLRHVGGFEDSSVAIRGGAHNGVVGCDLHDTGGYGIILSGGDPATLAPAGNYADNNAIEHTGVLFKQGVGISLRGVGQRAAHNLIHDLPRFGIDFEGSDHVIEYNHIHHVDMETEDSAGIYVWNVSWAKRGTEIRFNSLHDILGYGHDDRGRWASPHFAWGIYLDDGTCGTHVYGNIVARAPNGGAFVHSGRDNVIENNIFVDGRTRQMTYQGFNNIVRSPFAALIETNSRPLLTNPVYRARYPALEHFDWATAAEMGGNRFLRNIVAYRDPQALLFKADRLPFAQTVSDSNLIFHAGLPLRTGQHPAPAAHGPAAAAPADEWAAWRALGLDQHSLVAAPLFVNAAADDYRLQPSSPAFTLGFQPIPVEKIGPYPDALRASWPIADHR